MAEGNPDRGSEPPGELPPRNSPSGRGSASLVYLGTSEFAAGVLADLAEGPHKPALVITRPDAKQGRGRKTGPPPVAVTARELGIETIQPESVNGEETNVRLAALKPDAVILCAFGALVKAPLLTDYDILNVHPSLLPRWRGAAPLERAMMAGDAQTGVSIMRLVAELDAGPVYAQQPEPILPTDDYASLSARLRDISVKLLELVLETNPAPTPQPEDGVTYAEKLTAEDRTLDLTRPPEENVRIVRALHPHIGARVALSSGDFLGVQEAGINLDGTLELVTVQPAGGRPMAYAEYLRGHPPAL